MQLIRLIPLTLTSLLLLPAPGVYVSSEASAEPIVTSARIKKTPASVSVIDVQDIADLPLPTFDITNYLPVANDSSDFCNFGSATIRGLNGPASLVLDGAPAGNLGLSNPPLAGGNKTSQPFPEFPAAPINIADEPATANPSSIAEVTASSTTNGCNNGQKRSLAYHYAGNQEDVALSTIESIKAGIMGSSGYTDLNDLQEQITAALREPIDPNGVCRDCIQSLTLYQHGYPNAFGIAGSHYFRADRDDDSQPFQLRSDDKAMAFMAFLKPRMCVGGRIVFWSCSIACGEGGKRIGQAVSDYLDVEVKAPNTTQTLFYDSVDDPDDIETFTPR